MALGLPQSRCTLLIAIAQFTDLDRLVSCALAVSIENLQIFDIAATLETGLRLLGRWALSGESRKRPFDFQMLGETVQPLAPSSE